MNSLHLYRNLKALTPFLLNDFHQGKKNMQVPYLFYFIPEVLRYKQIGEKIITSEVFLNREKTNLFFSYCKFNCTW